MPGLPVSVGFRAWLSTTDGRLPLSTYRTVLEGTIIQVERLEARIEELEGELRLQTEHSLTSWVVDAMISRGWKPPDESTTGTRPKGG